MEFHQTLYLGRLIDSAVLPTHKEHEEPPRKLPLVGNNPDSARAAGEEISGRILSVTTNFSQVGVKSESSVTLRDRKGLSSLTAMLEFLTDETKWDHVKIAWLGEIEGLDESEELTSDDKQAFENLLGPSNKPVWLDGSSSKWRVYAENILWPTLHYSTTGEENDIDKMVRDNLHGWEVYKTMNKKYAEVVLANYKPGDIIMIHDMYLMLLPSLLREKLPNALIGLYVPSPFPSSELFKMLPQRLELLQGMLGATIIGFQSDQYIKHFISAATRITGIEATGHKLLYNGRYVACVSTPFGINAKHVLERSKGENVNKIIQEIRKMYAGKTLIIGRDKLDSTQGLLQKFRAFLVFLEVYPQWRGKVVFVQITTSTYQNYPYLEQELSHLISYINSKFGDIDYTPIIHFSRRLNQDEYFALLKTADVGYFTPIREGASSAAIEYILCKYGRSQEELRENDENSSSPIGASMVLSEFMGITDLLGQSNTVNPYDSLQVAFMLNQALEMSIMTGLSANDVQMYETASTHYDVGHFVNEFLSYLVLHDLKHENQHYTPEVDISQLSTSYKNAKQKLILLDYDGTLTPIVRDPEAAVPSERLKKIIETLTSDPNTTVWVISGRDMKFLDKHLAQYKINLSAEHGCYVKRAGVGPDGKWEDLVSQLDMNWMNVVMDVLQSYTERTEGSSIEKKQSAITWHYRKSDPIFGAFQASHLRAYLELTVSKKYPVDVMAGKANVEIRPKLFNKGEIVRSIFEEAHKKNEFPEFVLCCGDDTTDEDMFKVLSDQTEQKGLFSILVGPQTKLTIARWHANNVDQLQDALDSLKP